MIFAVWEGGMSFHGGMLGVAVAIVMFCRRNGIPLLGFADRIAVCAPIGLGLGRIANFINGELWGRPAPLGGLGHGVPQRRPTTRLAAMTRCDTVCAGLDPPLRAALSQRAVRGDAGRPGAVRA